MAIGEREAKWLSANSKAIIDVPDDLFAELLQALPRLMSVSSRSQADDYIFSVAGERSIDVEVVRAGIAWLTLSAQVALTESPDLVREQFVSLFTAESGVEIYKSRLERLIDAVGKSAKSMQMAIQRKASVRGLLPYYEEINATVELRAVLDDPTGALSHIGKENAKIIAVEPIASIHIRFDSGFPDEAIFQAGKDDVIRLIASLNALVRRIDELDGFVGGDKQ